MSEVPCTTEWAAEILRGKGWTVVAPVEVEDAVPAVTVDELAFLIRQLVHQLQKAKPDNALAARTVDYLRRKGLQGDIFSRGKVRNSNARPLPTPTEGAAP